MEKKKGMTTDERIKQLEDMLNSLEQAGNELSESEIERRKQEIKNNTNECRQSIKKQEEKLAEEAWYYGVNPKDIGLPERYWF